MQCSAVLGSLSFISAFHGQSRFRSGGRAYPKVGVTMRCCGRGLRLNGGWWGRDVGYEGAGYLASG